MGIPSVPLSFSTKKRAASSSLRVSRCDLRDVCLSRSRSESSHELMALCQISSNSSLAIVQYVWRSLRKQKIDLGGRKSWCESKDPEFAAEAADVVGLYMAPPNNAVVLCIDEKPSIQPQAAERARADRAQPRLQAARHDDAVRGVRGRHRQGATAARLSRLVGPTPHTPSFDGASQSVIFKALAPKLLRSMLRLKHNRYRPPPTSDLKVGCSCWWPSRIGSARRAGLRTRVRRRPNSSPAYCFPSIGGRIIAPITRRSSARSSTRRHALGPGQAMAPLELSAGEPNNTNSEVSAWYTKM